MSRLLTAEAVMARAGDPGLLLVDVRGYAAYREATIPGAISLNVYDYFIPSSDEAGFEDLERAVVAAFAETGIAKARSVVFFEEATGMISPRGIWFHEYAGLERAFVLDAGLSGWIEAKGPLAPGIAPEAAIASRPGNPPVPPMQRSLIASIEDVLGAGPEVDIFDVRRRSEFEGTFFHPCCQRGGRIPGAKFLFYEDLIQEGRYRSRAELRDLFLGAGLSPERTVITYCHRGARAATAYVALREAGFDKVRIFVGSWHEWATRADLPVATGA
jgi:thiosulfate/3-mercaptopyruvate sulfurtransferase